MFILMCPTPCADSSVSGLITMSQRVQMHPFVPSVPLWALNMTNNCSNVHSCFNCKLAHPTYSRDCQVWKDEKEILTIKYTQSISFYEARKIVEQRKKDKLQLNSSSSYANVASPPPSKSNCHTSDVLIKKPLEKFSEMADEL